MRMTTGTLMKNAKNIVALRSQQDRRLVCAYLTGSLAIEDDPMIGGTADIDLIFIHDSEPAAPREMVRLTDDVHLDIAHYSQSLFRQPRHLRLEPWLGSFICTKPMVLHDTGHWFDFTQASIFSQFFAPQNIIQRARPLHEKARQMWFALSTGSIPTHPEAITAYFKAIESAANAAALLVGEPLTERRFLLHFPSRAQQLQNPDLSAQLIRLFFSQPISSEQWQSWQKDWSEAYKIAAGHTDRPLRLHACRLGYYQRAAEALWADHPAAAAWLLIRTWSRAAQYLPTDSPLMLSWDSACAALNLSPDQFSERLEQLDVYLDLVEETLDQWEKANGI